MRIRSATLSDCSRIAALHEAELRDDLLHALGRPFLAQFYRTLIGSPHGVCFVAESDEGLMGFAAGCRDKASFNSEFLKKSWWKAPILLLRRIHRPEVWRCLATLMRGSDEAESFPAELLYIAVSKSSQGQGIGKAVFNSFRGAVAEFRIVTGIANASSNRLYQSAGCRRIKESVNAAGEPINVYQCTALPVVPRRA